MAKHPFKLCKRCQRQEDGLVPFVNMPQAQLRGGHGRWGFVFTKAGLTLFGRDWPRRRCRVRSRDLKP